MGKGIQKDNMGKGLRGKQTRHGIRACLPCRPIITRRGTHLVTWRYFALGAFLWMYTGLDDSEIHAGTRISNGVAQRDEVAYRGRSDRAERAERKKQSKKQKTSANGTAE